MKAVLKSQRFVTWDEAKTLMNNLAAADLEHTSINDGSWVFVLWAELQSNNFRK
jgi:hypothetical protein